MYGAVAGAVELKSIASSTEQRKSRVLSAALAILGQKDVHAQRLDDQVREINTHAMDLFDARRAWFYAHDAQSEQAWTLEVDAIEEEDASSSVRRDLGAPMIVVAKQRTRIPLSAASVLRRVMVGHESVNEKLCDPDEVLGIAAGQHVLCVPVHPPGGGIPIGAFLITDRNGNLPFTDVDEELAASYAGFAAIAVQTSIVVETLSTGVDREQLKVFPVHELGRIRFKKGWGTIRGMMRQIVSKEFQEHLRDIPLEVSDTHQVSQMGRSSSGLAGDSRRASESRENSVFRVS
jgi:hypothetical protein